MGGGVQSLNDTTGFTFFPHLKKAMPGDQKAKLLAMHRAGRANAGIYVGVVLAVYTILLTILLCRYARRHRSSTPTTHLASTPPHPSSSSSLVPPSHFTSCTDSLHSWLLLFTGRGRERGRGRSQDPRANQQSLSLERVPLHPITSTSGTQL